MPAPWSRNLLPSRPHFIQRRTRQWWTPLILAAAALGAAPAPALGQDAILTDLRDFAARDLGGMEWGELAQRVSVNVEGAAPDDLVCYSALVAPAELARELGMDRGGWGEAYETRAPNLGLWVAESVTDRVERDRLGSLRGCAPLRGVLPRDAFVPGDQLIVNGIFEFPDVLQADFWYETITGEYPHDGPIWFVMAVPADERARTEFLARPVVVLLTPERGR